MEVASANAKYPEPVEVEGLNGAVATCLAANANVSGGEVHAVCVHSPVLSHTRGVCGAIRSWCSHSLAGCVTDDGNMWLWGSNVNYQMAKGDDEEVSCCSRASPSAMMPAA